MDVDLSIVIPAFDEVERLPRTLDALQRFITASSFRTELVLSDDGSRDGTVALFEGATAGVLAQVVRSERNRGKGHAVRHGMLAARGAMRVMYDADGSMPAPELPKLLAPIQSGTADIAIGSRYLEGRRSQGQPFWRRAWSRVAHAVVAATLVPGIADLHCGYKAFTARAAADLFGRATIDGWAFDLEVLALAQRLGYLVSEVGVEWADAGRSRVSALRDALQSAQETQRIRMNLKRGVYGPLR